MNYNYNHGGKLKLYSPSDIEDLKNAKTWALNDDKLPVTERDKEFDDEKDFLNTEINWFL